MDKIKLTKEQLTQLVGGVIFVCVFGYFYLFYFWIPTSKTIDVNTKKVASMESDINKAKKEKAQYRDLEAKLDSLKAEKEAAEKKLPRERKLPDLLRTITTLSRKYRVNLVSITPAGSAQVEYFTRVSYNISLRGNYNDVGRFLTALGLEERIMTSENLVLTGTSGSDTSLLGQFVLVAYQYNG